MCAIITHKNTGLVENRVQLRDKDSGDLSVEEAGVVTSVADHVTSTGVKRYGELSTKIFLYFLMLYMGLVGQVGLVEWIAPTPDASGSSFRPCSNSRKCQTLQTLDAIRQGLILSHIVT